MTKVPTISDFKGGHIRNRNELPAEGSHLRALYDLLRTGEWITVHPIFGLRSSSLLSQLRDFYGMEIESRRGRNAAVRLTGEWYGPEYVSIDKIIAEEAMT